MLTIATRSGFELTPAVDAEVRRLCIDVHEMLKRAAICTLPEGNRRFHDWVFQIKDNVVVAITRVGKTPAPRPTRPDAPRSTQRAGKPDMGTAQRIAVPGETLKDDEFTMYEDHALCDGKGCPGCDGGEVLVVRRLKKI